MATLRLFTDPTPPPPPPQSAAASPYKAGMRALRAGTDSTPSSARRLKTP
eukprot:CAMPEP_0174945238 /NCGR_PEP_ID=MMETSP1355-20121228/81056_1 /TAXON_ID=464990 /ORGANISM="Hemiselmis tepida, Strain CCMP443" /LENGTH=49 /DNA_ID= /DNA_START= /DNA_END= /DNA_ORIENTATION=